MADDIRILTEGDLGDAIETTQLPFEDYTVNTPPILATAIANIVSGSTLGTIFANVKASLMRLSETKVDKAQIVQSLNITDTTAIMGGSTTSTKFTSIDTSIANINTNLGIVTKSNEISTFSVNAATWTTIDSITLNAGTYILVGKTQMPSGSGNGCLIRFSSDNANVQGVNQHASLIQGMNLSSMLVITSQTTVNLQAYCTSAISLLSIQISAMKIK